MIHEENKKQQPEAQDFSIEKFIGDEKKQSVQEQPTETQRTRPSASNAKRTASRPKKLTKEDYCGQFFKIPNTTASKGKSVYVRQEHHETFNRLTNIMGIDKLTIYAYLDNIIEHHFQEFGELIKEIYNEKHKPLF
ncbi:DUF3408 domain-containing protein [Flavobacterium dauae]|uniref:DUF3408 domain-containing protein n=1 Tax=Flavobacterium dauae TaxID=1563479 RepID=UPI00101B33F7|nr:DUF3408 domain-containing protein [Flavobacterium dauae]WLD23535.1 DUF3408 domain-containing protein [Flavobacterium dauae]